MLAAALFVLRVTSHPHGNLAILVLRPLSHKSKNIIICTIDWLMLERPTGIYAGVIRSFNIAIFRERLSGLGGRGK
jgi:hypothetical protein